MNLNIITVCNIKFTMLLNWVIHVHTLLGGFNKLESKTRFHVQITVHWGKPNLNVSCEFYNVFSLICVNCICICICKGILLFVYYSKYTQLHKNINKSMLLFCWLHVIFHICKQVKLTICVFGFICFHTHGLLWFHCLLWHYQPCSITRRGSNCVSGSPTAIPGSLMLQTSSQQQDITIEIKSILYSYTCTLCIHFSGQHLSSQRIPDQQSYSC